jgi:hypothetical protein
MAVGMVVWADGIMVKWWEWSNGGYGGRNGCMGGWNNGQMVGMVKWREWRTEWLYGRQKKMATYVLFTVHTDDNDDTLIFYSIE